MQITHSGVEFSNNPSSCSRKRRQPGDWHQCPKAGSQPIRFLLTWMIKAEGSGMRRANLSRKLSNRVGVGDECGIRAEDEDR
jgi:hypothetical protein